MLPYNSQICSASVYKIVCVVCNPTIGTTLKNTYTNTVLLLTTVHYCTVLCISEFSLSPPPLSLSFLFLSAQSIYPLGTGWTVRESNPGGGQISAPIQTGPGTHSASCTMCIPSLSRGQSGWGRERKNSHEVRWLLIKLWFVYVNVCLFVCFLDRWYIGAVKWVTSFLQPSFVFWVKFPVRYTETNFALGLVAVWCPDPILW